MLLPLLLVAQLMVILDITAVNIALPTLARDLDISGSSIVLDAGAAATNALTVTAGAGTLVITSSSVS